MQNEELNTCSAREKNFRHEKVAEHIHKLLEMVLFIKGACISSIEFSGLLIRKGGVFSRLF